MWQQGERRWKIWWAGNEVEGMLGREIPVWQRIAGKENDKWKLGHVLGSNATATLLPPPPMMPRGAACANISISTVYSWSEELQNKVLNYYWIYLRIYKPHITLVKSNAINQLMEDKFDCSCYVESNPLHGPWLGSSEDLSSFLQGDSRRDENGRFWSPSVWRRLYIHV